MHLNSYRFPNFLLLIYSFMIISFSFGSYFSLANFAGGDVRIWEVFLLLIIITLGIKLLLTNRLLLKDDLTAIIFSIALFIVSYISVFNSMDYFLWIKRMILFTFFILFL